MSNRHRHLPQAMIAPNAPPALKGFSFSAITGRGWFLSGAVPVSPELRASLPMLCYGPSDPERRRAYLGRVRPPAPYLTSGLCRPDTRTARPFIAGDAVPFAEAPEIQRAYFQATFGQMRPHFAGTVAFPGVPHHVNQCVQFPPIRIAKRSAELTGIQAGEHVESATVLMKQFLVGGGRNRREEAGTAPQHFR